MEDCSWSCRGCVLPHLSEREAGESLHEFACIDRGAEVGDEWTFGCTLLRSEEQFHTSDQVMLELFVGRGDTNAHLSVCVLLLHVSAESLSSHSVCVSVCV